MSSLRRTASYITLPGIQNDPPSSDSSHKPDSSSLVPYQRTLRYYKEQRERRKALLNRCHSDTITIRTQAELPTHTQAEPTIRVRLPQSSSRSITCPASTTISASAEPQTPLRVSSPLAPKRTLLPPRASFPRSKPEPDLYRIAITTRMRCSPEGQKILLMGPRLAVSILTATRELEKIVASQNFEVERDKDVNGDISMNDAPGNGSVTLSNSWVVVPGEDWEMVDCGA